MPTPSVRLRPATVLVAEDNEDARELYAGLLESDGFLVRQARDGAQAIAALKKGPTPELLVLDLAMPKVSGLEVLRFLRDANPPLKIRVLVLSAQLESLLKEAVPFDTVCDKLSGPDQLLELVHQLVGER